MMNFFKSALTAAAVVFCCTQILAQTKKPLITVKSLDPAFDKLVSPDAKAEIIAEGFLWSEGPLWIEKHKMLLFSDVRKNVIYKWTQEKGKEVYLDPSGYT